MPPPTRPSFPDMAPVGFGRAVVFPLAALVAAGGLLLALALWKLADGVDRHEAGRELAQAAQVVDRRLREVGRDAREHANGPAAYRALHLRRGGPAAADAVGQPIGFLRGYELVLVLGPDGVTTYALAFGRSSALPMEALVARGLQAIAAEARGRPGKLRASRPAVGLVEIAGRPGVAAVAALTPGFDLGTPVDGATPSLLVLVDVPDGHDLAAAGAEHGLEGLAWDPAGLGRLPLWTEGGEALGGLVWREQRLGRALMLGFLPTVGAALLAVTLCTYLLLRRAAERNTRALRAAADALRASEGRFREFAEASSDWFWETDEEGRFTFFSEGIAAALGADVRPALIGKTRWELFAADLNDPARAAWLREEVARRRPFRDFRYRIALASGRTLHIRTNGRPSHDAAGRFLGYRGTGSDVTAEVEAAARAEHLAFHDALTGLPNRVLLMERLGSLVAASAESGRLAAVLCLDLDRFKEVNDTRGHAVGDLVLQAAAGRLRANVREADTVARLGGDEFAVLQAGVGSAREVQSLCERLIAAFAEPFAVDDGPPAHVGLSIGVALAPVDGRTPADLLRHGDLALYRAKEEGRNDYRLFEPVMDAQLKARKRLETDLRGALDRGGAGLDVHYQPLVDVRTKVTVGAEALVRWNHPEHGDLSPGVFIPVVEQSGLIVRLGEWVLRRACAEAAGWPGAVRLSVNLSPAQLRQRGFADLVREVLAATGLDPARLELEITEGVLLQETEQAVSALEALKGLGVAIAMDDFGTGYSSLAYLQRFAFDRLKIDRSFVRDLFVKADSAAIIRAVIGLGRGLGMSVTAEGVETEAQLGFLAEEGCGTVQGFHLGRPMRPELFKARLLAGARGGAPAGVGDAFAPVAALAAAAPGLAEPPAGFARAGGPDAAGSEEVAARVARALGAEAGSLWHGAPAPARAA